MNYKNKIITKKKDNFSQWYTDICKKAELMDYSCVKGFIIYHEYGYAIWEEIKKYLDKKLKENDHKNVYMPLVIPETLFNKEKDHVNGFKPETLIATIGGEEKLQEKLIIRPTSEAIFADFYSRIINSYRDLPKLYNQWCSVVRWEKTTRPFIRGNEFLWQEGHTIHKNSKEAMDETLKILKIYNDMGKDILAIPFISGEKSNKEKFAGAEKTFTIETLVDNSKSLQCGTSHYFGQNFTKVFNVKFLDKDNKIKIPYQTSWGISTRLIGAIIMIHGDDNGLVLPPFIAPIQVIIIPIQNKNHKVKKKVNNCLNKLIKSNIKAKIDDSDHTPGWKFSEWEMKGVPIRIEIGLNDIEKKQITLVKRNDGSKFIIKQQNIEKEVVKFLNKINDEMYQNAQKKINQHICKAENINEIIKIINNGNCAKTFWCENESCENKIKELTTATLRCILPEKNNHVGTCPICKKEAKKIVLFAKSY